MEVVDDFDSKPSTHVFFKIMLWKMRATSFTRTNWWTFSKKQRSKRRKGKST